MSFEVNTLFLLTIDVEAILGLLLLLVWVQNTRVHAVAWWATAHLMRATSVMLYGLYGSVPDLVSIDLPNVLLFSSFGVTWNGARVFNGRNALPGSLIAGAALWLLASQWAGLEAGEIRGQLSAMIIAAYTWLTAYEFWRGRNEPLVSRWPAIALFITHGAMFLLRTPLNALVHGKDTDTILSSAWLSVLSLEAFLMTIATAFILLAMSKERTELRHKTAAMIDPLTGLLNRRAFLQDAETLLQQQIAARSSDRRAADRPRSFQVDQRPLRARGRRQGAADFRQDHADGPAPDRSGWAPRRRGIHRGAGRRERRQRVSGGGSPAQGIRGRRRRASTARR